MTTAVSCAPAASEGGFDSPDPGARLYAIQHAGDGRDASAIPHLIESLESDDLAERLYAINALERITGTRLGYRHYGPPAERHDAVVAWVDAYKAERFAADGRYLGPAPGTPGTPDAPDAPQTESAQR